MIAIWIAIVESAQIAISHLCLRLVSRQIELYHFTSMSGVAEASLVLLPISSVIAVFEAVQKVHNAAHDVQEQPKELPAAVEQNIRARKVNQLALQTASSVLEQCKENATRINDIFDETIPAPGVYRPGRLRKAVGVKMESMKMMNEMAAMVKNMELLAQHQMSQEAAGL